MFYTNEHLTQIYHKESVGLDNLQSLDINFDHGKTNEIHHHSSKFAIYLGFITQEFEAY